MAITKYPPNTIWLGGPRTEIGDVPASEAITPGMLVERFNSGTTQFFKKHSTAAGPVHLFATEQNMLNLGVDSAYASGDSMEVTSGSPGTTFWGLIASGANITAGDKLESAGNGKLRAWTNSTMPFVALESKNNSAGPSDARIRVEVM